LDLHDSEKHERGSGRGRVGGMGTPTLRQHRPISSEDADLWTIVRAGHPLGGTSHGDQTNAQRRTEFFSRLGSDSDCTLNERCAIAGVSPEALIQTLEGERGINESPKKAETLRTALALVRSFEQSSNRAPFAEILGSLADREVEQLHARLGKAFEEVLAPAAVNDLRRGLVEDLAGIAHHALLYEFHLHRSRGGVATDARLARLTGRPERQVYETFVSRITSDRGAALYQRYPALARLISHRLKCWRRNMKYLLQAVREDLPLLVEELNVTPAAKVERLSLNLSDAHHLGKSVAVLTFSAGTRIVYKPRSLGLEKRFMGILSYLNERAQIPLFQIIKMVERPRHGWCEFFAHTTTESITKINLYYRRTGYLLAVLHAFRATDCHFENIIASNGFPLAVDLETLCHPDHGFSLASAPQHSDTDLIYASVSRVGILPVIRNGYDGLDLSALGSNLQPQSTFAREYQDIGKAAMMLTDLLEELPCKTTMPSRDQPDRDEMVSSLCEGFRYAYDLIMSERENLLSRPDLAPSLRRCEARFIARPTKVYAWLLQRSLNFSVLHSGVQRSLEFERLFRVALDSSGHSPWRKVAEAERQSLEHLDIPHFNVRLNSRSLWAGRKPIHSEALSDTPWNQLRRRLQSLSEQDRAHQLQIIELSFAQKHSPTKSTVDRPIALKAPVIDHYRIRSKCIDIAEKISASCVEAADGSVSWLSLGPTPEAGVYRLQPCGPGLADGVAGISLFFAAAAAALSNHAYRGLSLKAFECLRQGQGLNTATSLDLGGGTAGISYAMAKAGVMLGERNLIQHAEHLLTAIPDERILEIESPDVTSGLAGILMAMQSVNQVRESFALRNKISIIAQKLLDLQISVAPDAAGWRTLENEMLPGFAHGSAGISSALLRAGVLLEDQQFITAARRGFNYTAQLFDPTIGNWRDPRPRLRNAAIPCSWCHGAIGIGLALGGEASHSRVTGLVERIIHSQCASGTRLDSACCGITSALEFLLRVSNREDNRRLLSGCIDYLCETSQFRHLPENGSSVSLPGMLLGQAGIGYHLLRVAFPEKVPPFLLFE
jgi:type 2 lantibiotic biosynthesis protein LanM